MKTKKLVYLLEFPGKLIINVSTEIAIGQLWDLELQVLDKKKS